MGKVIKIFNSFKEQEIEEKKYWQNLSGEKKLEILEYIRLQHLVLKFKTLPKIQKVLKITDVNYE